MAPPHRLLPHASVKIAKRSQLSRPTLDDDFKQIEANRRNALKSTGPTSAEGKQRSRCNAVRHGLTAETVIGALEDAEDYKAFEAAIIADYDAQSAVERELVLRLASLLWRLRRATTMETGLFEIQADHLRASSGRLATLPQRSQDVVYALFGRADLGSPSNTTSATSQTTARYVDPAETVEPAVDPDRRTRAVLFASRQSAQLRATCL